MGTSGPAVGTAVLLSVYLLSGVFQPILVDVVRYVGGEGARSPPTQLPMLFSSIGMAVAGLLQCRTWTRTEWALLRRRGFWLLLCVDFLSGVFIYAGLEIVGSGTFILIYASCLPWTAALSRCILRAPISTQRWVGVCVITLGLSATALQSFLQTEAEQAGLLAPPPVAVAETAQSLKHHHMIALGSAMVFLGSFFHALMFVLGELVLGAAEAAAVSPSASAPVAPPPRRSGRRGGGGGGGGGGRGEPKGNLKPSPLFMCAALGVVESTILVLYNVGLSVRYGPARLYTDEFQARGHHTFYVLTAIAGLCAVNGVHAGTFFFLLQQTGAVSMGVLKGVMTLSVFLFAAVFLCRFQAEQCITPFKCVSCVLIVTGSFIYYGLRAGCRGGRCVVQMTPAPDTTTTAAAAAMVAAPAASGASSPRFADGLLSDDDAAAETRALLVRSAPPPGATHVTHTQIAVQ